MSFPDLKDRPLKDTICLFDVDETLTKARQSVKPEVLDLLLRLRQKCAIGYVGGSDLLKQQEQLGTPSIPVTTLFDFCFPENGLTAFRLGQPLTSTSFIQHLGQEKYQKLAKFCLRYISELEGLPVMTGTFIEFRNGMINVSPVGRNASKAQRDEFNAWDDKNNCRAKFVETLQKEFADLGLTFSIGGQISFDVFPTGWDKTYCLRHVENEKNVSGIEYKNIHFFGDKWFEGGNDHEIYEDPRTIGHAVRDPEHTMELVKELFQLPRQMAQLSDLPIEVLEIILQHLYISFIYTHDRSFFAVMEALPEGQAIGERLFYDTPDTSQWTVKERQWRPLDLEFAKRRHRYWASVWGMNWGLQEYTRVKRRSYERGRLWWQDGRR
ncbi:Phosphomannomutase 1 [Knufia fluminis]|uniref:Phosphomannomutase n=1 Tax=Knufia fluminis TaxID=191047 RepID=A0AAN8I747_9EURO|nr:Phosphomannomutase 1 [Knufia fluminis]